MDAHLFSLIYAVVGFAIAVAFLGGVVFAVVFDINMKERITTVVEFVRNREIVSDAVNLVLIFASAWVVLYIGEKIGLP